MVDELILIISKYIINVNNLETLIDLTLLRNLKIEKTPASKILLLVI